METPLFKKLLLLTTLIYLGGCNKIPSDGKEQVAGLVQCRIEKEVEWKQGDFKDPQVQSYLEKLFHLPLTAETAVQIALLNNPQIQATFEEIGIAQADFVEAGLLSNPAFELGILYPHDKKLKTKIEYFITASLLDAFFIPLRLKLAKAEYEQAKLRVANEILNVAFEVKQTYYDLLVEGQKLNDAMAIEELTAIQKEISAKQLAVANIYQLELQQTQVKLVEAQLEIAQSQAKIIRLKEKLNRFLGLYSDYCWMLPEELPNIDFRGFDLCALENIAFEERLDLQASRFEIIRFARMLGLKQWWAYADLRFGIAGKREPDGKNLLGPGFSGEIPIFNFGQAARQRLFAQFRQAQDRLAVLEIQVRSEVREAYGLLMNNFSMVQDYLTRLLPLRKEIVESSEELYNVMGLGIDRLLENKRQEIEVHRNYLEVVKSYLQARIQLDRALGGYLYRLLPQEECLEGDLE